MAAEILAAIRSPFAIPTMQDRLGPKFQSQTLKAKLPNTFNYPAVVAISYQKRRNSFRERSIRVGSYDTLIGVLTQDIRRTEEQKTRNLHDHMPYYCVCAIRFVNFLNTLPRVQKITYTKSYTTLK